MLTLILGRTPTAISLVGEGDFFERLPSLKRLESDQKVETVVASIRGSDSPPLTSEVGGDLISALAAGENDSAVALYARGMSFLASRQGKSRWVQKATSYIFYVESILEVFPGAQMVFLARNPLDIAASLKRRGNRQHYMRMVWGWNRGVRLAQQYRSEYPDNFHVFRYEDLVARPNSVVGRICAVTGLEFTPECLEIPHVNRSESAYCESSETSGISASRVFYYQDVLTRWEKLAIRLGVDRTLLQWLYCDLPHASDSLIKGLPGLIGFSLMSGGAFLVDHLRQFIRDPSHAARRVRRRV
jgi:hypothetical protein